MTSKLTLSISPEVIEKAKKVAKREKTSLSKMVEHFLVNKSRVLNEGSVTELIIRNAPKHKIEQGKEKEILIERLKEKFGG